MPRVFHLIFPVQLFSFLFIEHYLDRWILTIFFDIIGPQSSIFSFSSITSHLSLHLNGFKYRMTILRYRSVIPPGDVKIYHSISHSHLMPPLNSCLIQCTTSNHSSWQLESKHYYQLIVCLNYPAQLNYLLLHTLGL